MLINNEFRIITWSGLLARKNWIQWRYREAATPITCKLLCLRTQICKFSLDVRKQNGPHWQCWTISLNYFCLKFSHSRNLQNYYLSVNSFLNLCFILPVNLCLLSATLFLAAVQGNHSRKMAWFLTAVKFNLFLISKRFIPQFQLFTINIKNFIL